MGSGLGKNTVWRGDYDIQLFDEGIRRRYRLGSLRYGDLIAIVNANTHIGPSYQRGSITIGVIVHGDSTVGGHGPGVTVLLSGPATVLHPVYDADANLAACFGVRPLRVCGDSVRYCGAARRCEEFHGNRSRFGRRVDLLSIHDRRKDLRRCFGGRRSVGWRERYARAFD